MSRVVRTLLYCAAGAVLALDASLLFWRSEAPPSVPFLLEHGLTIFGALALVALVAGERRERRAWAAGWVTLPCLLALWPESLGDGLGWPLAAALSLAAATAVLGWSLFGRGIGSPLLAAPAGALLGAGLARFHFAESHAPLDALAQFGGPGLAGTLLLAATVAVGLRGGLTFGSSIALRTLAVGLTLLALFVVVDDGEIWTDIDAHRGSARQAGSPVVLIVLDTLRADHLAAYGYRRDTMPALERVMRNEGVVADRSVANAPYSLASHASMFTGLHPPRHGATKTLLDDPNPHPTGLYPLGAGFTTLAERLTTAGYRTVGVAANFAQLHPKLGMGQGFQSLRVAPSHREEIRRQSPWCMVAVVASQLTAMAPVGPCEFGTPRPPYRQAREITDEAIDRIDDIGSEPFFLFVNYWDAHNPLLAPAAYRDAFDGGLHGREGAELEERLHEGGLADIDARARSHYDAAYDSKLAYLDDQLARLLARLRAHPRWHETLVIVTSDHGLALGEHGHLGHETQLYDEFTRVPLFVKPGVRTPGAPPAGTRLGGLHESVDVFPLILSHAGLAIPDDVDGHAWGSGRLAARSWLHKDPFMAERDPVFERELRSVQSGRWKMIESTDGSRMLFDLAVDAGEHAPLAADVQRRLRDELAAILGPRIGWIDAPLAAGVEPDRELMGRLRSLGYVR